MAGFFTGLKTAANVRHYRHEELEDGVVGTEFANDTADGELLATTRPLFGRVEGTYGISGSTRRFDARGEEALSPRVDQTGGSAFTYQEAVWPHLTVQFGGRVEHQRFTPAGGLPPRDFTNVSGSAGLLLRPSDATTVAVSLARSVRNPALEELYFNGPHSGNFAFEIGNDGSRRGARPRVSTSPSAGGCRTSPARSRSSATRIDDFVFRRPTGDIEDDLPVIAFSADRGAPPGRRGARRHRAGRAGGARGRHRLRPRRADARAAIRCRACRRCARRWAPATA